MDARSMDDAAHRAARDAAGDATRPAGAPATADTPSAAVGAAAGAAGGMMAGLQVGALAGALTLGVGGLAGIALGAAAGVTVAGTADPAAWSDEHDVHYRALHEGRGADDGVGYDRMRAAYRFGHFAAAEPSLAGRTFGDAEPALRDAWTDELRAHAGPWEQVRAHVADAYGHARSEGVGTRRVTGAIGSAGSAVDPVELERARQGGTSDGRPLLVDAGEPGDDLRPETVGGPGARHGGEVDANTAHRRDAEYR